MILVRPLVVRPIGFGADIPVPTVDINGYIRTEIGLTDAQIASLRQAVQQFGTAAANDNNAAKRKYALQMAASIPIIGTAFAGVLASLPPAEAGPGRCATDPPWGLDDPKWIKYDTAHPPTEVENKITKGGFLDFMYTLIKQNWELENNCRTPIPWATLLAAAFQVWNGTHLPTEHLLLSWQYPPGAWDHVGPIEFALRSAEIMKKPGDKAQVWLNWGPLVPEYKHAEKQSGTTEHNSLVEAIAQANLKAEQASSTSSTAAKAATATAVVAGAGLVGTAIYAYATHRAMGSVFDSIWKGTKGLFTGKR